jgi:hypothetical protein
MPMQSCGQSVSARRGMRYTEIGHAVGRAHCGGGGGGGDAARTAPGTDAGLHVVDEAVLDGQADEVADAVLRALRAHVQGLPLVHSSAQL